MVKILPSKRKRRIRTITPAGRAMRHAQRSGSKHRRGQFIKVWKPNWRKKQSRKRR